MESKSKIERRKLPLESPPAEEPKANPPAGAADVIPLALQAEGARIDPQCEGKPESGTAASKEPGPKRYKVQVELSALEYWQLGVNCLNLQMDRGALVRSWITPRLDEGTYPTRPKWVVDAMRQEPKKPRTKKIA